MNERPLEPPAPRGSGVLLPCAESCAAFRPLSPDQWSEYGLCLNPHSPRRGFPVRIGRDCRNYLPPGGPGYINRAS